MTFVRKPATCAIGRCTSRAVSFKWRGDDKLRGQSNYLIGRDARHWHTRVPHFARVISRGSPHVPGVVVYGNRDGIEYDLRLAPKMDASQLRLKLRGDEHVRKDRNGDLIVSLAGSVIRMTKPVIYEQRSFSSPVANKQRPREQQIISGGYVIEGDGSIGFHVAPHDPGATVVIDPSLSVEYGTFLGGAGSDQAASLALDASGNVYIAGTTTSVASFPETPTVRVGAASGASVFFVAKINPAISGANSLVYLTFLGGSGNQAGGRVAVDGSGDVAIAGTTTSMDFPVTDSSQPTSGLTGGQGNDLIVSEIDPTGSQLLFSTMLGGNGAESKYGTGGIAVSSSGELYVAADTTSTNLPVTVGAFQSGFAGQTSDGFLAVFDPTMSPSLKYCSYLGLNSDGPAAVSGIAVDAGGDAYVVGATANTVDGFPAKNAFQSAYGGGSSDAFLMKVSPAGQGTADLVYATLLGGSDRDAALAVAVDSATPPRAYVTGTTRSANFPIDGLNAAFQTTLHANLLVSGSANAFLAVVTQDAGSGVTSLGYSTYLGGSGTDAGQAVAVPDPNSVYVAGTTNSPDFPWHDNLQPFNGSADAFVAKFDPASSGALSFFYATPLGGTSPPGGTASTGASGIASDGAGHVFVAGQTTAADFPTAVSTSGTLNGFQPTCVSCQQLAPASDAFVAEVAESATQLPSVYFSAGKIVFSALALGTQSSPQPVALYNGGEAPLTISSVQVLGPNAADFSASGTSSCAGQTIDPGASPGCTSLEVAFDPSIGGPEEAVLAFTDNAPGSPQMLELVGAGQSPHALISPSSVDFANQPENTTSNAQTITVTNTGTEPLTITSVAEGGTNPTQFLLQGGTCQGTSSSLTLAANGGSCFLDIAFAPTVTGVLQADIEIQDNSDSAENTTQTVPLTGNGTAPAPLVEVSPQSLDFGSVAAGSTTGAQLVTLTNQGSADLLISSVAVSGANPSDFTIDSNETTCPVNGGTLTIGASCNVAVQFAPQSDGSPLTATLNFADNAAASPQKVALSGTATAPSVLQVFPDSLTFAGQSEGNASAPQEVTISNEGSSAATIGGVSLTGVNATDFTLANPCAPTLAAGKSCQVSVTFDPAPSTSPGPRSATLSIPSGNPSSVSITGTALQSAISIAPSGTSINFGTQTEGSSLSSGTTVNIQVTNSSSGAYAGPLAFSNITLAGQANSAHPDFDIETNSCISANTPPGGSCSIQVIFAPACINAPATRNATLTLTDNAPGSPQAVALTGTASGDFCFAPPPSATATPGQTATFPLELLSADNFSGAISLSCAGAPPEGVCTAPSTVSVGQTFTVTVSTTAGSLVAPPPSRSQPRDESPPNAPAIVPSFAGSRVVMVLAAMPLLLLLLIVTCNSRDWRRRLRAGALLLALTMALAGCRSGGGASDPPATNPGTPPGTYTVVVTATDAGGTTRTAPLIMNVN